MAKFEKQYSTSGIQYSYNLSAKKWAFRAENGFTFLTNVPGGADNAGKIAGLVAGGLKRSGGMRLDPMARGAINRLIGFSPMRQNFARI